MCLVLKGKMKQAHENLSQVKFILLNENRKHLNAIHQMKNENIKAQFRKNKMNNHHRRNLLNSHFQKFQNINQTTKLLQDLCLKSPLNQNLHLVLQIKNLKMNQTKLMITKRILKKKDPLLHLQNHPDNNQRKNRNNKLLNKKKHQESPSPPENRAWKKN